MSQLNTGNVLPTVMRGGNGESSSSPSGSSWQTALTHLRVPCGEDGDHVCVSSQEGDGTEHVCAGRGEMVGVEGAGVVRGGARGHRQQGGGRGGKGSRRRAVLEGPEKAHQAGGYGGIVGQGGRG